MSNGLGAGFFALTVLAVLGGLALLDLLATAVAWGFSRRTGQVPAVVRYLLVALGAGVLVVTGFVVLATYDEAPAVAWLFAAVSLVPLLVAGGYLARTGGLSGLDAVVATVMAWGAPFLLGVVVVFGTTSGITSALDLAPAQSRQFGVAWMAAAVGGVVVLVGTVLLGSRLGGVARAGRGAGDEA